MRMGSMEVEEVLHMNQGTGEASYANNSQIQSKAINKARNILQRSIEDLCSEVLPECMIIADLGCSSGPNVLTVLLEIIEFTCAACQRLNHRVPEVTISTPYSGCSQVFTKI